MLPPFHSTIVPRNPFNSSMSAQFCFCLLSGKHRHFMHDKNGITSTNRSSYQMMFLDMWSPNVSTESLQVGVNVSTLWPVDRKCWYSEIMFQGNTSFAGLRLRAERVQLQGPRQNKARLAFHTYVVKYELNYLCGSCGLSVDNMKRGGKRYHSLYIGTLGKPLSS